MFDHLAGRRRRSAEGRMLRSGSVKPRRACSASRPMNRFVTTCCHNISNRTPKDMIMIE